VAIALTEVAVGATLAVTSSLVECAGRLLGISEKSLNLYSLAFATIGNMYGINDPEDLAEKKQNILTPIKSVWDVCDTVGLIPTTVVSGVLGTAAFLPAILGLNYPNGYRFIHYLEQLRNDISARRSAEPVDRSHENYHQAKLEECEITRTGKFFSEVNVLRGAELVLEGVARVAATTLYGVYRLVLHHGLGLVPLIKFAASDTLNLTDPFDRIKQRFKDLQAALTKSGHLPCVSGEEKEMKSVDDAIHQAKDRAWIKKAGLSLFSEARKIVLLGKTEDEKVLKIFGKRFNEFTRICRRHQIHDPSYFFTTHIPIPDGERFSFEVMLDSILRSYTTHEEKQKVRQIAAFIRSDIEKVNVAGHHATLFAAPVTKESQPDPVQAKNDDTAHRPLLSSVSNQ
jgi:hypothetical protein